MFEVGLGCGLGWRLFRCLVECRRFFFCFLGWGMVSWAGVLEVGYGDFCDLEVLEV